jgi:hypothetical protein
MDSPMLDIFYNLSYYAFLFILLTVAISNEQRFRAQFRPVLIYSYFTYSSAT